MSNLDVLLPQRDLRFTRNILGMGAGFIVAPILLALTIALAWWQAPGLLRDFQIRANPMVLDDYDLRNAKCTSHKRVVTDCEADVAYVVDGARFEQHVSLMFLGSSREGYEVALVVDADAPERATLSLGLDYYWNRLGFFLVVFLGLVAGVVATIVTTLRNGRISRAARQPQRWVPELVEIRAAQSSFGGTLLTYAYPKPSGRGTSKQNSRMARKEEPLLIEAPDGSTGALALRPATGGVPLLLDAGLRRIDLTETERQAVFTALSEPPAEPDPAGASGMGAGA